MPETLFKPIPRPSDGWSKVDDAAKAQVTEILGSGVTFIYNLKGEAPEAGHEHFGYMDGITQPAVMGFTTNPLPGQPLIDPGVFLLGEPGDTSTRPAWAKGGSTMATAAVCPR